MSDKPFTKENLDHYLKELAKEFRKRCGKSMPAEIILIGGASVVINYGFREMTYDMDAIINAASSMKDAINFVGDKFGLPNGWMNDDFMRTESYTPRINRYSKYYHTYSNTVTFRTVTGEYLVAMKLKAGREYKYDRSDVIGILWEQEKMGDPLTLDRIKQAVTDLYDSYDVLADDVKLFIERALKDGNYEALYARVRQAEAENKENLLEYQEAKPGVITNDNVSDNGDIVTPSWSFENAEEGFSTFLKLLKELDGEKRIGFEATGHYGLNLMLFLEANKYSFILLIPDLDQNNDRDTEKAQQKEDVDVRKLPHCLTAFLCFFRA